MKLVDSKMPGWVKALFFLGLCLAYFLYANMTGDESWLLSAQEKNQRRAYVIAQKFINRTYAPPSPARFPSFEEVSVEPWGNEGYHIEGWVWEPDDRGQPQRFDFVIRVMMRDKSWIAPMLRFKDLEHGDG